MGLHRSDSLLSAQPDRDLQYQQRPSEQQGLAGSSLSTHQHDGRSQQRIKGVEEVALPLDCGPVPGLRCAFLVAQLAAFIMQAETWCQAEGAAYLAEVIESLDDMSAAIGLAAHQRQRLSIAIQDRISAGDGHMPVEQASS